MKKVSKVSAEKLRGGFYTPASIASFILKWGFNGNNKYDVLEPSCGNGIFLEQIKASDYKYNKITAVELDESEAKKVDNISLQNKNVFNIDFHRYCNTTKDRFDLIVGNPPYIRYQYFDAAQQSEAAKIFYRAGLKYTKLTNAWVSFVVGSSLLLKDKGKLGFVLPAELLQVSYAQQLRRFLANNFNKINIISFKKLVFEDIQQEVVLLLCEKSGSEKHLIEHLELNDASELLTLDVKKLKSPKKQIDFNSNKWTFYFLNQEEIDFIENVAQIYSIPLISDFASVEVGITTGANEYFTLPLRIVEDFNLHNFVKPMVGRSVQVDSIIFNDQDWDYNRKKEARAHLLVLPSKKVLNGHHGVNSYIAYGESLGINKGYKTSIRDDWFVVPSVKKSEALFIRRNHLFPRLILNEVGAYTTDTMHRVFIKSSTNLKSFIASFYNSLSFAFSELSGRSYGGGVLELMPSETGKILLPYCIENEYLVDIIDKMMRSKMPIDEILKISNEKILKIGYGLTAKDIKIADNIWKKLSARRLNRIKE